MAQPLEDRGKTHCTIIFLPVYFAVRLKDSLRDDLYQVKFWDPGFIKGHVAGLIPAPVVFSRFRFKFSDSTALVVRYVQPRDLAS